MQTVPWTEKYRPKSIDDIVHQEEIVQALRNTLATGNLPHLLFYGPPGTGKTSTILAIAHQLFGPELIRQRVKELNASDERGIEVVRTKIKDFASRMSSETVSGYPCPPFKIIVLDEADAMTSDAQHALRRTMELHTKYTRFCIICNYVSRIIEPIASRCAKFRFRGLPNQSMLQRLQHISQAENVDVSEEALSTMVSVSGGDMRRAVTLLQCCFRLSHNKITPLNVLDASAVVPMSVIKELLDSCRGGYGRVQASVLQVISSGFSAIQVVQQLCCYIASGEVRDMSDEMKARVCLKLGEVDGELQRGADETLQLLDAAATIMALYAQH